MNRVLTTRRTVTPSTARQLVEKGFKINVERSPERIFDDEEFEDVPGVTMVPTGSWPNAPEDHVIIGLKELPEEDCMRSSLSRLRQKLKCIRNSPSETVRTLTYPTTYGS